MIVLQAGSLVCMARGAAHLPARQAAGAGALVADRGQRLRAHRARWRRGRRRAAVRDARLLGHRRGRPRGLGAHRGQPVHLRHAARAAGLHPARGHLRRARRRRPDPSGDPRRRGLRGHGRRSGRCSCGSTSRWSRSAAACRRCATRCCARASPAPTCPSACSSRAQRGAGRAGREVEAGAAGLGRALDARLRDAAHRAGRGRAPRRGRRWCCWPTWPRRSWPRSRSPRAAWASSRPG